MHWAGLASRLVDELVAGGHLPDSHWRDAFAAVPRHVFVPRFYRNGNTVVDGARPADRDEWLAAVYADTSLVTQTRPVPGTDLRWATSSSTRPSLMARMLHLLEVSDGQKVLEIGTGTGYNAALLSHRLSDTRVVSVDLHPELVTEAGVRLASLGYRPRLLAGDGAAGAPAQAPYDRIIATCAVPTVPPPWVAQLDHAGVIVVDIRGELCSSLAVLRKIAHETVEGRFLALPGHFMWLRSVADNPLRTGGSLAMAVDRDDTTTAITDLDPALLDSPDVRFLLQHLEPAVQQIWPAQRDGATVTVLHAGDGSWAEVGAAGGGGRRAVTQGGPRPLWTLVEQTVDLWARLGRPSRARFGLTATATGDQWLWSDRPDSGDSWRLP